MDTDGTTTAAINFCDAAGRQIHRSDRARAEPKTSISTILALTRVAIENAVLKIEDYVYISGGLAFTRQAGLTVTLSGTGGRSRGRMRSRSAPATSTSSPARARR